MHSIVAIFLKKIIFLQEAIPQRKTQFICMFVTGD